MAKGTIDIKSIKEKFSATALRLAQERNDFLLAQVVDFVRQRRWLNLRPEYQRRQVWDDAKRSLFIEWLLLNVPIPPVFLYEYDLSRYEVMDGLQRLNSILDLYENRFALKKLEKWEELAAKAAVARTASCRSDVFRHAKKIVSSESNTDIESVWPV